MSLVAFVGRLDELLVETPYARSRLVSGDQQDGPALRVKGEGNPPDAVVGIEARRLWHLTNMPSITYFGGSGQVRVEPLRLGKRYL
jgi:hypothetical protein